MSSIAAFPTPDNDDPHAGLSRGQCFTMRGIRWRVAYVNASRAHCIATVKEPVTVRTRTGQPYTFAATRRITIDISPNSAVELFTELERER